METEKQRHSDRETLSLPDFWNLKSQPQWFTSSRKVTTPNPSNHFIEFYSLVTKHSCIWSCGGHRYKPSHWPIPSNNTVLHRSLPYSSTEWPILRDCVYYSTLFLRNILNTSHWHVPCDGTMIMLHFPVSTKVDSTKTTFFPTIPRMLVVWCVDICILRRISRINQSHYFCSIT